MLTIEECIKLKYSVNKICGIINRSFIKTKELVIAILELEGNTFEKYSQECKKLQSKEQSINRKGKIRGSKSFFERYNSRYENYPLYDEDYIKYASDANNKKDSRFYLKLRKFIDCQYKNYNITDNFYAGLDYYLNTKYNAMEKNCYIARYGDIKGVELYNKRITSCNVFLKFNKEEREIHIKKMSESSLKYFKNEPEELKRKRIPVYPEFWMKKENLSYDDAIIRKKEFFDEVNKNRDTITIPIDKRVTRPEYYMSQGLTLAQSTAKVSERQSTFSKEKCIEKHGKLNGLKIWQDRQYKWQATLNNKSGEEKLRINISKCVGFGTASKASLQFFKPLISLLTEYGIILDTVVYRIGIDGNTEFSIQYNNSIKFYDFCIPILGVIIEFHGMNFHYSPEINGMKLNYLKLDVEKVKQNDEEKEKLAIAFGYDYIVVWENLEKDYTHDVTRVFERIRDTYWGYSKIS